MADQRARPSTVIRGMVPGGLRTGRFGGGLVVTRCPPEPDGHRHVAPEVMWLRCWRPACVRT